MKSESTWGSVSISPLEVLRPELADHHQADGKQDQSERQQTYFDARGDRRDGRDTHTQHHPSQDEDDAYLLRRFVCKLFRDVLQPEFTLSCVKDTRRRDRDYPSPASSVSS